MSICKLCSLYNLFVSCIKLTVSDVVCNSVREQLCVLKHHCHVSSQLGYFVILDVDAVDGYLARIYVVKAIKRTNPDYILIENVPALLKLCLNYKGELRTVLDILKLEFGNEYDIDSKVVDSSDYGVPQVRLRAIIKMHKFDKTWNWPETDNKKETRP